MTFRSIPSLQNMYEINEDGTIFRNCKSGRELKIKLDTHHSKTGYYVTFIHIGGRRLDSSIKRIMIHRAVAECWLGPCPPGMEVDHINRNSLDNHYTNLRYVTKSEQMQNRDHSAISKRGARNLELARKNRMIPIRLIKDSEVIAFESTSACARFLAGVQDASAEKIRYYLRKRVSSISNYDIVYE